MKTINIIIALVVLSLVSGCMSDRHSTMNSADSFMKIYPINDYSNFSVEDLIKIEFIEGIDPNIAERNITLIDLNAEQDFTNDLELFRNMMGNKEFRQSMMKNNSVKCTYRWDNKNNRLELDPESNLDNKRNYCVVVDSEMVNHMNDRMKSRGLMSSRMDMSNCNCMKNKNVADFILVVFKTK